MLPGIGIDITIIHLTPHRLGLEGWDFPEAAYVASLGHLQERKLPHITAKAGYIRSSGCHNLWSGRPPPGKNSRASVSGGKVSAL